MLKHLYERSLKMRGPDAPGTKTLKRQLDEAMATETIRERRVILTGLDRKNSDKANEVEPSSTESPESPLSED
jgi:hypothetical protein